MFMRGNIDHLEQPEEYHKMAVPGKLKFLWNIKLKFLNENTTIGLPANIFTPTLTAVASQYFYPHPVSSCQRIPLPPTLSAVASGYLYPHPVSSCYRIPLPPPCQQLLANTVTPTLSAVASEYPYPHPVSSC